MQINQPKQTQQSELTLQSFLQQNFSAATLATTSAASTISYHEMDAIPVREVNELAQLSSNIEMLSNLRSKIQFMNREIRYLMKV